MTERRDILFNGYMRKGNIPRLIWQAVLIMCGALLMAFNLKAFCAIAGIIPGGFTGLTILFNEVMTRYFHISLPFSVVYYVFNAVPVYIGFRYIGKWFTLFSCLMVFLTGVFTDWIPPNIILYLNVNDYLLCALFGGIINAFATNICLYADATSGGTDFIAIYFSEKRGTDAWNYIFAANCCLLLVAVFVLNVEKALYSVIFQFASTMTLTALYKGYQQKTLLIITEKPDEVYALIRDKTNHDATSFTGIGRYSGNERIMLYSVVSSSEVHHILTCIKEIDPQAFVNVLRTDYLYGRFYKRPRC